MNNKPLSRYKLLKICECFSLELTATQTANLLTLNRKTVNRYYRLIREAIWVVQLLEQQQFAGHIELDESYFGGYRKGLKGRSTKQKIPVFGMLKRGGKVYTQIVPDVKSSTLRKIIQDRTTLESVLYSDGFASYDGLVLDGYEHLRVNHRYELVNGRAHINGIESFWSFAKQKLSKFYGIRPKDFHLYLKEMEFRFNNRAAGHSHVKKLIWAALQAYQLSHSVNTLGSSIANFVKHKP